MRGGQIVGGGGLSTPAAQKVLFDFLLCEVDTYTLYTGGALRDGSAAVTAGLGLDLFNVPPARRRRLRCCRFRRRPQTQSRPSLDQAWTKPRPSPNTAWSWSQRFQLRNGASTLISFHRIPLRAKHSCSYERGGSREAGGFFLIFNFNLSFRFGSYLRERPKHTY